MNDRALPIVVLPPRPVRKNSANDVFVVDGYVERALEAMRANPTRRWTVAALARVVGLSRAPFARRFQRATGTSPHRWLTEHRLGLAQERLLESDDALAEIASAVGYGSDFAFSKAFKRLFGMAPGVYGRVVIVRSRIAQSFRAAA